MISQAWNRQDPALAKSVVAVLRDLFGGHLGYLFQPPLSLRICDIAKMGRGWAGTQCRDGHLCAGKFLGKRLRK